jgi:hypothetical protein
MNERYYQLLAKFSNDALSACSQDVSNASRSIESVLQMIQKDSADVNSLSKDVCDVATELLEIMAKPRHSTTIQQLSELNAKYHDHTARPLLEACVNALMLQDKVHQQLSNMGAMILIWLSERQKLANISHLSNEAKVEFGKSLLTQINTLEEIEVIQQFIPELADSDN